ncbi:MAG: alkaline phosphatase family protein [Thermoplasmata archaeon]
MVKEGQRVLVLGIDGGTFDLIDPLVRAGVTPFLASLLRSGARSPLQSVFPPKTIPAWYSFATGQDPGSLGIFGFTEPDGGPGKSKLIQTFRPAEAIWDHLSRHGCRVGVVNFPIRAGYPINGFVIPGMISERPATFPPDLRATVESELAEPWVPELPPYRDSERESWMNLAERGVTQRARATRFLIERYAPDFLFVLFRESDRIQHQHWAELEQPVERWNSDLVRFWKSLDSACREIDAAFRRPDPNATTLVISDHGHGIAKSDFFTNRWLLENHYLYFRNGGDSQRRRLFSKVVMALDRFPVTRRLVSAVAERVRENGNATHLERWLGGNASFEGMADKIDWDRTVAFSHPVPEGIYLNRWNPHLTPDESRQVVREIRSKLEHYPAAHVEVFEPAEIYEGSKLERAPALLLKIDNFATEPRMDFGYPSVMLEDRPSYFYGSGVHRMNGILMASGPGIHPHAFSRPVTLLDIAPTILDLMQVPVPATMTGHGFGHELGGAAA